MNNFELMTEEEGDEAHTVSEQFQDIIVAVGTALLLPLTPAQREYVLVKAHDEFRFWRIEDELKGKP